MELTPENWDSSLSAQRATSIPLRLQFDELILHSFVVGEQDVPHKQGLYGYTQSKWVTEKKSMIEGCLQERMSLGSWEMPSDLGFCYFICYNSTICFLIEATHNNNILVEFKKLRWKNSDTNHPVCVMRERRCVFV